jgi:hypothetical protein
MATVTIELSEQDLMLLELCVAYSAGSVFGPKEIDMPAYERLASQLELARFQLGERVEVIKS